jgi:hypothetical protein
MSSNRDLAQAAIKKKHMLHWLMTTIQMLRCSTYKQPISLCYMGSPHCNTHTGGVSQQGRGYLLGGLGSTSKWSEG